MRPPKQNAEFCWHMEDVLDIYTRPYDRRFPQVCFDERPVQLLADVRAPCQHAQRQWSAGERHSAWTMSTSARGQPTSCSGTSRSRASGMWR